MTSQARRRPASAFLAAAALLTSACGSTVQSTGDALGAQSGGARQGLTPAGPDGLSLEQPGPTAGEVAPSGGVSSGGGTGAGPSATGGSSDGAGATGGSSFGSATGDGIAAAPADASAFVAGPGVTATEIRLGIPYCGDCAAADAALGAGGESPGDTRRYFQAALDDVNSRGGVLGRKLVPIWHQISASENVDSAAQAACETFTKDNKVAVIFFRGEISYQCAKQAGIIAVGQGGSGPVFDRFPNMFAPGDIRLERLGAVTVKGMVAAGWHKPEPKWPTGRIGLITWQNSDYKFAMEKGWLPALRESGLKADDVRYVAVPQSDKSIADSSAAISSAVLSFREQGIDHVFIADGAAGIFRGGGLTLQFLNAAKSQRYYPRYGFNSNNAPGDPNLPADQQVGMVAVSSNDFTRADDEGIELNPQRERCYQIMKKKGLAATDGEPTGITAIGACGVAWFAEAVFERATAGTSLAKVIAAAESLGTSYRSPGQYGTRIGPGRHDGDSFFRNARFDESCSCMKYSSKPYEP